MCPNQKKAESRYALNAESNYVNCKLANIIVHKVQNLGNSNLNFASKDSNK